ncbi:hypothetical protein Q1695_012275 [Nippostrongylus brasiliensis]|nr:hypothetical protein Q1695_012275 [Nippostrongylus brasiliensis]
MPLWANMLIERFDLCASSIRTSMDRLVDQFQAIQENQRQLLARLDALEEKINSALSTKLDQKSLLYSTLLKFQANAGTIEGKSKRIAWIGIEEKGSEEATKRFDREILKEVVHTSGDAELIANFDRGLITAQRHPHGKPRAPGEQGRLMKIFLPNQELRDSLLAHMKTGRQSLTQRFTHSFARRDYTTDQLMLDRAIRKEAGERNAREGRLASVVPDFQIVKLSSPRELPRGQMTASSSQPVPSQSVAGSRPAALGGREGRTQASNSTLSSQL